MARKDIDPVDLAIIETEREIAQEAWGEEHEALDLSSDRTVEELGDGLEGQHEPEDEEPEGEEQTGEESTTEGEKTGENDQAAQEAEGVQAQTEDGKPDAQGRVPAGVHREMGERARAAEAERDTLRSQLAERDAAHKRELDALNAKFDGVLATLRNGQQPQQAKTEEQQKQPPDMFEDPQGFVDHITQGFRTELAQRDKQMADLRVENSMAIAHATHKDAFTNAFAAVQKLDPNNAEDRATVQRIYNSSNPGEALVSWHKRNEALREVGDDLTGYQEKLRSETREALMKDPDFRKALLDELRAEAGTANNGQPNLTTRLPRSLNGAAGAGRGAETFDSETSDQAIADSAWR